MRLSRTKRKKQKRIQRHNCKLIAKYPWLTPRNDWTGKVVDGFDYTWTEIDALPSGWVKGFGKVFIEELGAAIEEAGLQNEYMVVQAKEKYGSLRWYDNGGTSKTHHIIHAFERISERVCCGCGKLDVPMTNDGWYSPYCRSCFKKMYRRREKFHIECAKERGEIVAPKTEEQLDELYNSYICDESDENGQYLLPTSYTITRFSKDKDNETITYDISEYVDKIRRNRERGKNKVQK